MENNIKSYLTFKIGHEIFATSTSNVQSIIEYSKPTKLPEMPPFIPGILDLRGEILIVIDSRIKLGIPAGQITRNTCIIVLELNVNGIETKAGMLVDDVHEVLEIEDKDIKEPPSLGLKFKADIITGVFRVGDTFILLLNIYEVVATEEILKIPET